jgi:hypothetical protein
MLDGSQHSVQDTISRLKFISTINPGEKIDVGSLTIYPDTIMGRASRALLSRETRHTTLDFLRKELGEAFDIIEGYSGRKDQFGQHIAGMVAAALLASRSGVAALAVTYSDDRMFAARIRTLIETLDAKLSVADSSQEVISLTE